MAKQRSKAELIQDIQTEHRRLDALLETFSDTDLVKKGVVGDWSIKDVIVHLTAWEQILLDWYQAGLTGEISMLPAPVGMSKKAINALNKDVFRQNEHVPLKDALADYQNNYRHVLSVLETIPEEAMFSQSRFAWTGKLTLADYIAGNTCNHYYWAKTKIRAWMKTQVY